MPCPKCQGFVVTDAHPLLRHVQSARCLICGWWFEEGSVENQTDHAAWQGKGRPYLGIIKTRKLPCVE